MGTKQTSVLLLNQVRKCKRSYAGEQSQSWDLPPGLACHVGEERGVKNKQMRNGVRKMGMVESQAWAGVVEQSGGRELGLSKWGPVRAQCPPAVYAAVLALRQGPQPSPTAVDMCFTSPFPHHF